VGIANGTYKGFARGYVLASEIVAFTDNVINEENLKYTLKAYQNKKMLSMEEICNIPMFTQIAIIENVKEICSKIYASQMQKQKVENIIDRLIESKNVKIKYNKYKSNEITPFVEHMAYKLKAYGKKSNPYVGILEEEVNKMGLTIAEIIKREHTNVALQKVSIGNAITSIKELQRISFTDVFEETNGVEELLKKDPSKVYEKMDYKTKEYYRATVKTISKKTKISEIYIVRKALELCHENNHIGYYLIDKGKTELINVITNKNKKPVKNKESIYIITIAILSVMISIFFKQFSILVFIPISEVVIKIVQYVLSKIVKPKLIPKLNYIDGIPDSAKTFVVIPTIIKDVKKVEEMMRNLEVYYLANKSKNIYFALLSDPSESKNETEPFDELVLKTGLDLAYKLSEKYKDEEFPKFHFWHRKRVWNEKEGSYLGWERKRGLLCQFNKFILENYPEIKYVITLDADTNLTLNSGIELISAMEHTLNTPVLSKKEDVVVSGYGIMQPRVSIDIEASNKSLFTKIFAGSGGVDSYANAVSDIYQDNFHEGIFTGKGIYNVKVFNKILKHAIPENTVLSHDLLEGSYLRCGLCSDVILIDGCPYKYNAYSGRAHRWIRGDFQIMRWLFDKSLNRLSKFKILDNLRRGMLDVFLVIIILLGVLNQNIPLFLVGILVIFLPLILDIINAIVFKNDNIQKHKLYSRKFSVLEASLYRTFLNFVFLPHKAFVQLDAIIKTLYRLFISKKHLLEWTTAEELEKSSKTDLKSYYRLMITNVILGVIVITVNAVIGMLFLIAPIFAYYISKEIKPKKEYVKNKDKEFVKGVAKKTWIFFEEFINEENNFLPPDNYQEDRKPKVAYRTSPTNIGLRIVSCNFSI